jgi:hypothetical protein
MLHLVGYLHRCTEMMHGHINMNWIGLCCPWDKELREDLVEILFANIGRQKSPFHPVHLVQ